jgi:protein tyrosine phosphatase (PTP) superfamily phosphohydrolase (DUF442 family)
MKIVLGILLLATGLLLSVLAVQTAADETPSQAGTPTPKAEAPKTAAPTPAGEQTHADHPDLHQFAKVADRLFRSAQPETDEDFAFIAAQGVKVIVSVDGARPDVERARKHGLRYVHVPIGYEGIPMAKAAVIAKAVTTLDGPFLFHCHHGKHRGPAACAIAMRVLGAADGEGGCSMMKKAGTADRYAGLYRDVREFPGIRSEVLAAIPADLPEAVSPQGMIRAMVEVDHTWDRLKSVKDAGWKAPPEHPDVAPAHEAVILAEGLREMLRLDEVTKKPESFRNVLAEAEKAAWDLAGILDEEKPDAGRAALAWQRIDKTCLECHKGYRDIRDPR